MELNGMIVTVDAMNCQKETAAVIHDGKGEYVLALKGNQGLFYEEVKGYFDEECLVGLKEKEGCIKGRQSRRRGRIARGTEEWRTCCTVTWVSHLIRTG